MHRGLHIWGKQSQLEPADFGFKDAVKGDFSLKEGSWLLEKVASLKEVPFGEIGLYKKMWRTVLPPLFANLTGQQLIAVFNSTRAQLPEYGWCRYLPMQTY